jgi:hypothetical protein
VTVDAAIIAEPSGDRASLNRRTRRARGRTTSARHAKLTEETPRHMAAGDPSACPIVLWTALLLTTIPASFREKRGHEVLMSQEGRWNPCS